MHSNMCMDEFMCQLGGGGMKNVWTPLGGQQLFGTVLGGGGFKNSYLAELLTGPMHSLITECSLTHVLSSTIQFTRDSNYTCYLYQDTQIINIYIWIIFIYIKKYEDLYLNLQIFCEAPLSSEGA